MEKQDIIYSSYINILKEELIPAMGCTEPIALAYAAAYARDILGSMPDRVEIGASGSIIKNVKSVIVPNTDHLKGIPAAAAAGIVAGDASKELEVISSVDPETIPGIRAFLENTEIQVEHIDNGNVFDIIITLFKGDSYAKVRIADFHTNIVLIERNGEILKEVPLEAAPVPSAASSSDSSDESALSSDAKDISTSMDNTPACSEPSPAASGLTDRELLTMEKIYEFAESVDIEDVRPILERQIRYNMAIAEEGLKGNYGANIGSVLLNAYADSVQNRAKAWAAAGSDARMNGCELPVIINSGSGNQGITVSVPVVIYANELGVSEETLYRALVISNLTAIHEKTPIGRLSAYCGAVSAGAGAGAGIAYLCGGGYAGVIHTVVNALSITSGIICDGAKASCAAKIASSVDAGILGYQMYTQGQEFMGGDGIVSKGVEATLKNVGRLGKEGMKETNEEIIRIMMDEE